jgi:hypothetical protein
LTDSPVPEEMYQRDRGVDPVFSPDEDLYIRFSRIANDGKVELVDLKVPGQSVNRSKYSKPQWVLLSNWPKFINHGFGSFKVGEVPVVLQLPNTNPLYFQVEHKPLEDNYSHSEICAYKDNLFTISATEKTNKSLKLEFRSQLRVVSIFLCEFSEEGQIRTHLPYRVCSPM